MLLCLNYAAKLESIIRLGEKSKRCGADVLKGCGEKGAKKEGHIAAPFF